MALRCLLFSSNEEKVQPIWSVLAELDIQGEYCESAISAVERLSTQLFQLAIIDWDDQPDALSLLKTLRDLKAAQRPLTLAIVGEEALPAALQAGANSVLVKPIRAAQVLETLSTACELLRAKQPTRQPAITTDTRAASATAPAGATGSSSASVPLFVIQAPEKPFRAGEFLQSPSSAPSEQFDTECVNEVQKSLDQAAISEVDALTELEPTASVVQDVPAESVMELEQAPPPAPEEPLTGWASLQARITKNAAKPSESDSAKNELLGYGETPSYGMARDAVKEPNPTDVGSIDESEFAAAPAAITAKTEAPPVATSSWQDHPAAQENAEPARRSSQGGVMLLAVLAVCAIVAAVPATRKRSLVVGHRAMATLQAWLNPPPPALPQPEPLHDNFGQAGDEFKLPASANVPGATTDPSQIHVEPVVDPTAKPDKTADANQVTPDREATVSGAPAAPPTTSAPVTPQETATPIPQTVPQPVITAVPAQRAPAVLVPVHTVPAAVNSGIPSSLKSQIASSTPDASGPMPPEAAMSSIEPVVLPEATVLDLLAQQPAPAEYPAKANGQRGSVVLQLLIGRDGTVKDAKFLQGSLVFARSAIDAVKQWQFRPYSLNGRPVSVQSSITVSFRPPAQ